MKICVIDNDEKFLAMVTELLARGRHQKLLFKSSTGILPAIRREIPDGLIWNISLFCDHDIGTLQKIRVDNPAIFVALTGEANANPKALQLLDNGSCEFLRKPVTADLLAGFIRKLEDPARLSLGADAHPGHLIEKYGLFELIGKSPEMLQVYQKIEIVSKNHGTVLIRGERGTCRELVARAIHQNSPRRKKPFVKFPCSIVPEALFGQELFGDVPDGEGGGHPQRKSRFEVAAGGTLLLDEIEHVPLEIQIRLVEYFEGRPFQPSSPVQAEAAPPRIIATSCANLNELVEQGRFRHELYYRINVLPIDIPPLRKRSGDIPMAVEHFLRKYAPKGEFEVHPEAMKVLVEYPWPANVRQLENIIERLVLTVPGRAIFRHHLPEEVTRDRIGAIDFDSTRSLDEVIEDVERLMIKKALYNAKGNMKLAANSLGVPYSSFRIKMRKLNLS